MGVFTPSCMLKLVTKLDGLDFAKMGDAQVLF